MLDMILNLHDYNSVFQAELAAIDEAISWCIGLPHDSFHLYTDSLSSIYALQRLFPSNGQLFNIFNSLRLLHNKVIYVGWIKSHAGISGNERAGMLAKSVITNDLYDKVLRIPAPTSILKQFYMINGRFLGKIRTREEILMRY